MYLCLRVFLAVCLTKRVHYNPLAVASAAAAAAAAAADRPNVSELKRHD